MITVPISEEHLVTPCLCQFRMGIRAPQKVTTVSKCKDLVLFNATITLKLLNFNVEFCFHESILETVLLEELLLGHKFQAWHQPKFCCPLVKDEPFLSEFLVCCHFFLAQANMLFVYALQKVRPDRPKRLGALLILKKITEKNPNGKSYMLRFRGLHITCWHGMVFL